MKKNMGNADRVIRLMIAAVLVALYFTGVVSGTLSVVLISLSVIFILTSFVSVCPLYLPFGLNSLQKKPARNN